MNNEILENHQKFLERKKLYTKFNYDIDSERDFVLKQAQPLNGRILEVGTGKGHFALVLAKNGYSFTTCDISQQEIGYAKLNLAYYGLEKKADFRIENAERTSFADGSFDAIFSIHTLHHFVNPYKVIDELIRILSPKGKIILSDFSKEGFDVIEKIHAAEGNAHSRGNICIAETAGHFEKKGFTIKRTNTVHQDIITAEKE